MFEGLSCSVYVQGGFMVLGMGYRVGGAIVIATINFITFSIINIYNVHSTYN